MPGEARASRVLLCALGVFSLRLCAKRFPPSQWKNPNQKLKIWSLSVGALTIVLSQLRLYWIALPIWATSSGLGILFNINTASLRQAIVPNDMLSRVMSIAGVLAWSAIPAGALVGGAIVKVSGRVDFVYAGIGVLNICVAAFFRFFTALGDAQRYVDERKAEEERFAAEAAAVF